MILYTVITLLSFIIIALEGTTSRITLSYNPILLL